MWLRVQAENEITINMDRSTVKIKRIITDDPN